MPSRRTCLLTCLGAVAFISADFYWRYKIVRVTEPVSIQAEPPANQEKNNSDTHSVSTTEKLPPGEAPTTSFTRLLRETAPGDPATMRAIEALAQDSAQAIIIGRQLMQSFPDRAAEIGTVLIGELVRACAHADALELAQNGSYPQRTEWMTLVLSHWTQSQPADASLIADLLREKDVATETFAQVAENWAASAPETLAQYALALPSGDYRTCALNAALAPWIQQNPAAVASCLPQLTEPAERDQVLALLATHADTNIQTISQTVSWAEAVNNPELRRTTLARVVHDWFDLDPAAATRYLLANPAFDSDQRQSLIASLSPQAEAN